MKRFIVDFILILILVMIGSSITVESSIDDRIDKYEESIQLPLNNELNGNKATHIIKKSGDMIENILEVSVEVISSIFKALIE